MGPRPPDHTSDRNSDDTSDHTSDRTSDRFSDLSTDAATDIKPTSIRSTPRTLRVRHVQANQCNCMYASRELSRTLPPDIRGPQNVRARTPIIHARYPKARRPYGGASDKDTTPHSALRTLSTPHGTLQTREVVARPSRRAVACSTTPPSPR